MKKAVVIKFENSTPSAIPTKAEIEMELVEVPVVPADDGLTYVLEVTDGVLSWVQKV